VLRRLALTFLSAAGFASALAGCPPENGNTPDVDAGSDAAPLPPCAAGIVGDPNKDPVLELRALKADGTDVPLNNGDDLAVLFPPQGGRVSFVGVRVLNLDTCGVMLLGAARDTISKQVRLDGRTVNLKKDPDGWATTGRGTKTNIEDSGEIGDYANIPLCPNQWAEQDIYDKPFEIEVTVTDRRNKTVTKTIAVTPRCAEPGQKETSCKCLCRNGYVLGETCGEDAGVDGSVL